MIKELIKLASHLDNKGFHKEANYLDVVIKRAAIHHLEPGFDPGPPGRPSLQDLDLGNLDANEIIWHISISANKELRELSEYKTYGSTVAFDQINRAKYRLKEALDMNVNTPIFEEDSMEYIEELLADSVDDEDAARNLYELISPIGEDFWEDIETEVGDLRRANHNEGEKLELIREIKSLLKRLTKAPSSPMAEGLSTDINVKLIRLERMELQQ
jgi:hypothetical protein